MVRQKEGNYKISKRITFFLQIRRLKRLCITGSAHMQRLTLQKVMLSGICQSMRHNSKRSVNSLTCTCVCVCRSRQFPLLYMFHLDPASALENQDRTSCHFTRSISHTYTDGSDANLPHKTLGPFYNMSFYGEFNL